MRAATLKELAGAFPANRIVVARAIRKYREMDPPGFLDATVQILRESSLDDPEENPGAKYLLVMLLARPDALERICDSESFSPAQSVALVRHAKTLDPQVEGKLARLAATLPYATDRHANLGTRVLEVLEKASDPATALPALRQLLHCPSRRVRSKAVLLIGRISRNPQWAKLGDAREDQRVVANAVESLWGLDSESAQDAFREALRDPRKRVAGNGALGLYLAGELEGAVAMFQLSRHNQPGFRSTAAWCMGRSGDPRFLPRLAVLLRDPAPEVRAAAFRAAARVGHSIQSFEKAGRLTLQIRTAKYHEHLHTIHVLVGDGGPATHGLKALAFSVLNGDDAVEQYTLAELGQATTPVYEIRFQAPLATSRLITVKLHSERGCGADTGCELTF